MSIRHETTIGYDYEDQIIRVFSTRESTYTDIRKRLGEELWKQCEYRTYGPSSHYIDLPMSLCRKPEMLVFGQNKE
jgi:hypothetical protein